MIFYVPITSSVNVTNIEFRDENNLKFCELDRDDSANIIADSNLNIMVNKHNDKDKLISGWLLKKVQVAKIWGKWKKVFCVVHHNKMKYYEKPER